METLIEAMRIYYSDIGFEFGIEKYAKLITRIGKGEMTERIELPNQEKIRTFGVKETYKYLGILDEGTIKQAEMKKKFVVSQEKKKATWNQAI